MDNTQAKFLLSSFRPDGADAHLPEFADALKLAAENRELGEWLAHERATDAAFAKALNDVPIPNGLRDEILAVLAYDGGIADVDLDLDGLFTGGMASIKPPEGLRDQILAAMEMEQGAVHEENTKAAEVKTWRWLSVAAIAAAVAVVALFTMSQPILNHSNQDVMVINEASVLNPTIGYPAVQTVAVHSAVQQMATKLKSPDQIHLNTNLDCAHAAMQFLDTKRHPVPSQLPVGLEDATLVGARDMYLESGQPISLLCFEKQGLGMVHLIVVDLASLTDADKLTSMKSISLQSCYGCKKTQFNIAHWREGEKAYMILTKAKKKDMVKLF
ncbi:MAG: hypothetical protein ABGY95_11665 [Rubritalea sp.]|uniref:hypothetical protein n=1 Tax=Rubritalea sp. TaxID=2109375 RepID=UPI003242045F